jgi:phosphotransferase system HPr (HPr) family protein
MSLMRWRRQKREAVTVSREITIVNPSGLHARPAAEFARKANSFRSEIVLIKEERRYNAASVIDILRANLDRGTTVMLEAHGSDAGEAVETLARLVAEFDD